MTGRPGGSPESQAHRSPLRSLAVSLNANHVPDLHPSMRSPKQGIRANWRQFGLQVLTVFAVGLTVGTERTVVPLMGEEPFGTESVFVIGFFVGSFGGVKALLNLYAGKWTDAYGQKPVLIAGWLSAVPIPFINFCPELGMGCPRQRVARGRRPGAVHRGLLD